MKWYWDLYWLLRSLNKIERMHPIYTSSAVTAYGSITHYISLEDFINAYTGKKNKLSKNRINKLIRYAVREKFVDTSAGENGSGIALNEKGMRFIDNDLWFIPTRLIIAWHKEDGKAIIAAFIGIFSLLTSILVKLLA